MYGPGNVCMICRTKSKVNNSLFTVQRIKAELERITDGASEEELRLSEKELREKPYLRNMCETHIRCEFGLPCSKLNIGSLNQAERDISELVVLAKTVDHARLKSLQNYFRGTYPKAAQYIFR